MKPFFVLIAVFLLSLLAIYLITGNPNWQLAGRIGMSAMLLFTAMGHFMFSKGMELMIPAFIPFRKALVFITGVIEILAAIMLLIPAAQELGGWLLIVFFILITPANIYAAISRLNYQTGQKDGPGPAYLWLRLPLQVIFIAWVYFSCIWRP